MGAETARAELQKFTILSLAMGVLVIVFGALGLEESEDLLGLAVSAAALALGMVLVIYDVRRRLPRLSLGVTAQGQVLLEEPGRAPQTFAWTELTVYEPGCLGTLLVLKLALWATAAASRELWLLVASVDAQQGPFWTLAIYGCLAAGLISDLVARAAWVRLAFPGRRGTALFSFGGLEQLGAPMGFRTSRAGIPVEERVIDTMLGVVRDEA